MVGVCAFMVGCTTYRDIPLTEGSVPYALKPGVYEDVHGNLHNEKNVRWSVSEADLFRDTQNLVEEKSKFQEIFTKPRTIMEFLLVLAIVLLLARKR